MPPIVLLYVLLLVTIGAVLVNRAKQKRQQVEYRKLAVEHGMHYSPRDPLRLTPRVAAHMPLPGASAVRVIDLLYRTDDERHYYVFTAEFTVGVAGPKDRVRQAAAFTESKSAISSPAPVQMADAKLPLLEQYRSLIK